jgi:fused-like protein
MAPEMLSYDNYDISVDIWSLGVLAYELFTNNFPFYAEETETLLKNIMQNNLTFPKELGSDLIDLIKKMLSINPKNRIKIDDILKHQYIKFIKEDLEKKKKMLYLQGIFQY